MCVCVCVEGVGVGGGVVSNKRCLLTVFIWVCTVCHLYSCFRDSNIELYTDMQDMLLILCNEY